MTDDLSLAADFPAVSEADWLTAVEKALKGAPIAKLTTVTEDGIEVAPLYARPVAQAGWPGAAGAAPFLRGSSAARAVEAPWSIAVAHAHPVPSIANRAILQDLERGATALTLTIAMLPRAGEPAREGIRVSGLEDLETALAGVYLEMVETQLDAGSSFTSAAAAFAALARARGIADEALACNFGADPLVELAAAGSLPEPAAAALSRAARLGVTAVKRFPRARAIHVDGERLHAGGASEAQELGGALAAGVTYLRALGEAGLSPDDAAAQIGMTLAADADLFLTIAKLRAARLLWSRILELGGARPRALPLHARMARRMVHARDPWVNMLRGTAACFGAAIGGADRITIAPFNEARGLPTSFSRRIARNTQVILAEESSLGRVVDAAGGSHYVEHLTEALADKAWGELQAIEAEGGFLASVASGAYQSRVAATAAARRTRIATRRLPITGVSEFPNIAEAPIETEAVDPALLAAQLGRHAQEIKERRIEVSADGSFATLVHALEAGARLCALEPEPKDGAQARALPPRRLGEDFERLRSAAERAAPKAFLANLGSPADFTARATFAKNVLEAGGIAAPMSEGFADPAAAAAAFSKSGAKVAIVCSTDTLYAEHAADAAKALKAAGASVVMLAGRPGESEAALRAAGIDQFIYMGCNVVDELARALKALGVEVGETA